MLTYLALAFGVAGVLFGLNCYRELWKWAKLCQRASISIAYNRRVQLTAPLVEWLTWAGQLDAEQKAKGRVVYRNGKVTVAILGPKAAITAKTTVSRVRNFRRARKQKVAA